MEENTMLIDRVRTTLAQDLRYHTDHSEEKMLDHFIQQVTDRMFDLADQGYTYMGVDLFNDNPVDSQAFVAKNLDKIVDYFTTQGLRVIPMYDKNLMGEKVLVNLRLDWEEGIGWESDEE